jgi:hypothetical protein
MTTDNLSELMWRLEIAQKDCTDDGQAAAAILLQDARGLLREQAKRIEKLEAALRQMVEEKCDYMRINNLGDPETQHTVKAARAALAPEQDK